MCEHFMVELFNAHQNLHSQFRSKLCCHTAHILEYPRNRIPLSSSQRALWIARVVCLEIAQISHMMGNGNPPRTSLGQPLNRGGWFRKDILANCVVGVSQSVVGGWYMWGRSGSVCVYSCATISFMRFNGSEFYQQYFIVQTSLLYVPCKKTLTKWSSYIRIVSQWKSSYIIVWNQKEKCEIHGHMIWM